MKVYLQYHNAEVQGKLPHLWSPAPLRLEVYTKAPAARQAAGQVLLLTGLGQPREFYLWSTFQIEKQLQHPDGHTVLEGPGWPLLPPRAL
ncbi:MAG TPA: hypothetical protein PKA06_12855, partial [Gemmatales bacterium]|nr:hypothetical protein [Gemmatales bacterium]